MVIQWKRDIHEGETGRMVPKVMSKIYDAGNFPRAWKASLLLMVYRGKGDMKCPSKYRGMSLLSTQSKINTGALPARINDLIERKGIFPNFKWNYKRL
jgi:hypothetical protein